MKATTSLQMQAYNYIKDNILSGKLDSNILYSETKLSNDIGISRTPMREALQCLSQDGYISIIPSKGFMIRQLNDEDMMETIQIRCAIEGFCIHTIANEIDTEKAQKLLKELKQLLENQKKSIDLDDSLSLFMEYDHQFHLSLVRYMNNTEFNHTFQRLMYLIRLTTKSALSVKGRVQGTIEEHRKAYHYLESGDGDAAYRVLIEHLMMPLSVVHN